MMAIGIGCRKGTPAHTILAVVHETLNMLNIEVSEPCRVVTGPIKANETGIVDASRLLGAEFMVADEETLQACADRTLTHSATSLAHSGLPSLCEAAALAGAGLSSRLLGPRHVAQGVTCAIAISEDHP